MARTAGKKQSQPATPLTNPQIPADSASSSIPEPFVLAPAQLRPLTSTLPTHHVYAIHIDSFPSDLKRRVFMVPVLMNIVIAILLAVRVYYAAPVYLDQIITIFGYETAWKVRPEKMDFNDLLSTVAQRTGLLMIDYAIFGILGSWPWEFLFGSKYLRYTGPLHWRRNIRFRDTEIIVRIGRKWDRTLFAAGNKPWTREQELLIMTKVEPALRKSYTSKTGYLLLDKDWDLDFKGMIDAHALVEKGKLDMKTLDHIVLVHHQKQWLLWRVHEGKEPVKTNPEDDAKIRGFRDKLAKLGHEEIFFRWIEIVQYETSLTGGFSQMRQASAIGEVRSLLQKAGIDDTKFLEEIGGQRGLPGLDKTG